MSFLGMSILGVWLEKNPIKKNSWKKVIVFSIYRLIIGFLVFLVLLFTAHYLNVITFSELRYLLIIPILPVAANILVLETYYLNSNTSTHTIIINTIFSLVILMLLAITINLK